MAVSLPGVVLSSLIFRLKNEQGDAVGFFLGETYTHSVSAITDTQCQGTREERKTCIQEYLLVEGRHSFSNNCGEVNFDKLNKILNNRSESVVGWFSYCCNCSLRTSLIQKAIHSSLIKGLEHNSKHDLLFCLFNECSSDDSGINTTEYSFYKNIGNWFQHVHVDIVNLESTSIVPYQMLPIVPIPSSVKPYSDIINYAKDHLFLETGELKQALEIERLCRTLVQRLEPLTNELTSSYESILKLDEEIKTLRDQMVPLQQDSNDQTDIIKEENYIPPLIKLGDEIIGNKTVPTVDLLAGSPPPTDHTPLIPTTGSDTNSCNEVEMEC